MSGVSFCHSVEGKFYFFSGINTKSVKEVICRLDGGVKSLK